jgi:hypothetical protein
MPAVSLSLIVADDADIVMGYARGFEVGDCLAGVVVAIKQPNDCLRHDVDLLPRTGSARRLVRSEDVQVEAVARASSRKKEKRGRRSWGILK